LIQSSIPDTVQSRLQVEIKIDADFYNRILQILDSGESLYTDISDFVHSALRKETHLNMRIK